VRQEEDGRARAGALARMYLEQRLVAERLHRMSHLRLLVTDIAARSAASSSAQMVAEGVGARRLVHSALVRVRDEVPPHTHISCVAVKQLSTEPVSATSCLLTRYISSTCPHTTIICPHPTMYICPHTTISTIICHHTTIYNI